MLHSVCTGKLLAEMPHIYKLMAELKEAKSRRESARRRALVGEQGIRPEHSPPVRRREHCNPASTLQDGM